MLRTDLLPAFFADLRSSGFGVGPREQERVFTLLLHLQATGTMPQSSRRLASMLAPLLCTNAEQQLEFDRRFGSYFGVWSTLQPQPSVDPTAAASSEKSPAPRDPSVWGAMTAAEQRVLRRLTVVFALCLVLSYLVPYALIVAGVLATPEEISQGQTRRQAEPPQDRRIEQRAPPRPLLTETLPKHLLGAPGAAWRASSETLRAWLLFAIFPVFAAAAYWVAAPARPFSAFLSRRQISHAPEMVRLLLRSAHTTPFRLDAVYKAVQQLRRPRWIDSDDLSVDATLERTIASGGLFTPVRAPRRVAPEYLMLVDRRSSDDHVAGHADALLAEFRRAIVYVDCYSFNGDPRRVSLSTRVPSLSLDELTSRHPEHRLILVTSGDGLFDPVTGALFEWARTFARFQAGVMLTPVSRELWGHREEAIVSELKVPVLPLTPQSLPRLAEILVGPHAVEGRKPQAAAAGTDAELSALHAILEDRPIRWIDDSRPEPQAEDALMKQLRAALSPSLLRWMQAAAAYPALSYPLTLHLGQITGEGQPGAAPRSDGTVLFALPWFRRGRLPLWLRRRLIAETKPADFERIRGALGSLLLTHLARSGKTIGADIGTSRAMPPRDRAVLERMEARLRDPVLIEYLSRRQRDPTRLKVPRLLARIVAHGGWLHNLLSKADLEEIEAAAEVLAENVRQLDIQRAEISTTDNGDWTYDVYTVEALLDAGGATRELGHGCRIHLPTGEDSGRLLDEFSATIYIKRRRIARSLALTNLLLVTILGIVFYSDEQAFAAFGLLGVAVLAAMAWLLLPFWLTQRILVMPLTKRFHHFPAIVARSRPDGAPPQVVEVRKSSRPPL